MRRSSCLALVACIVASAGEHVQIDPRVKSAPSPRRGRVTTNITAETRLIMVPVTVHDAKGAPVQGLPRERFRLFEDGVEQKIQSFGQDDAPASIGIALDASRSMQAKLAQAREAVARLFDDALPGDEFHLVEFNDSPRLMCDLTMDTETVRTALDGVVAKGWTALFDGVFMSAQLMRRAHNPRRALLILSDGADNFSRYQETELRAYLREAGVVVFSIGLTTGVRGSFELRHLRRWSLETGGWCYSLGKLENLGDAVRAIGTAIRSQYVLTYTSTNPKADGKYRRIGVQVLSEKGSGLRASWRAGYYASDSR